MPKRPTSTFTKDTAKQAKIKAKRYELRDVSKPGLFLRVQPTGTKTWMVQLDRTTRRKVGDANQVTLGTAWEDAKVMLGKHADGEKIKSSRSPCPTLEKFIDGKYRTHAKGSYKTPERGDQVADRILKALDADPTTKRKKLDKIGKLDIERWKRKRDAQVKRTTLKRDLGAISTALNLAVHTHKYIDANPAHGVQVKAEDDKRVRFLSPDEQNRLLAALEKRDKDWIKARKSNAANRRRRGLKKLPVGEFKDFLTPLVILTMNTGLRRSEALGLTWEDVQLDGDPRLTVQAAMAKTSKTRHVPLNKTAVDILKRWRKQAGGRGPVFAHPVTGAKLNKAHRSWKKLMEDAEIEDFRFHDLRHHFASQLVMKGQPLYMVKELLGHGSISMTERYSHLADHALKNAVDAIG